MSSNGCGPKVVLHFMSLSEKTLEVAPPPNSTQTGAYVHTQITRLLLINGPKCLNGSAVVNCR